ncbi:MAG: oxidative stress defense protein [Methanosaeta sp. PtaU1.Bin112]|nr:MAG: oxidative stress defense protein [Methanosaeta sp. PtaU1.Bin112]
MKWLVIAFGIMIAAALPAVAAGNNPTLTVVGEGTASVPADIAIISASVQSGDENMTEASAAVQEKMTQVIDALKAAGVKDDEIMPGQSSGVTSFQSTSRVCKRVNNSTICDNGTTSLSSLERSIVIRLKSTDETRINHVLDAARSAGAEAEVAGYGLSDSSKAATQARAKAVANAKENAAAMAAAEGMRLGKVVDISDYGYPMALNDLSGGSAPLGTVDVKSFVLVTYEIEM